MKGRRKKDAVSSPATTDDKRKKKKKSSSGYQTREYRPSENNVVISNDTKHRPEDRKSAGEKGSSDSAEMGLDPFAPSAIQAVQLGGFLSDDIARLNSTKSQEEFMQIVKQMSIRIDEYMLTTIKGTDKMSGLPIVLQQGLALRRAIWEVSVTNVRTTSEGFINCQNRVEGVIENLVQLQSGSSIPNLV